MNILLDINSWNHFLTLNVTLNVDMIINCVTNVKCNERTVLTFNLTKTHYFIKRNSLQTDHNLERIQLQTFYLKQKKLIELLKIFVKNTTMLTKNDDEKFTKSNLWSMQRTTESAHFEIFKLFISSMCAL